MLTAEHTVDLSDPQSSIDAARAAIGRLHKDATVLSEALSAHLRTSDGSPEVRAFLARMRLVLDEFRRAADAVG
jgi:hypothetical protein